jgi:hypothetical protein
MDHLVTRVQLESQNMIVRDGKSSKWSNSNQF